MNYFDEQYIESLHCALDGCYRDLDYYESIGHQSRIDEVLKVIESLEQQIESFADWQFHRANIRQSVLYQPQRSR